MKHGPYVPRLPAAALVYVPQKPGFAQLAAQMLGNNGTAADGFDSQLNSVLSAFSAIDNLLASLQTLGKDLAAADAVTQAIKTGDIDKMIELQRAADAASAAGLDAAIRLLNFTPQNLPGIAPAPSPPVYNIPGIGIGMGTEGSGVGQPGPPIGAATAAGLAGMEVGNIASLSENFVAEGSSLLPVLGAVAQFAPIVGAFVGLGLLLAHYIGHGCGAACTDAAKAEQIYEIFADNLIHVFLSGMISKDQALAGAALALEYGQQHLGQMGTQQAQKGLANMQNVIRGVVQQITADAPPKPKKADLSAARALYVGGPGWYPDSVGAAAQLTDEYLQSLR